ncbi:MAG: AIPR family protein, partial [Candidatus Competibacteraceae bacterium]|nr:AIPR family protein [Candidatus Competibacteraceae bacterium]
MEQTVEEFFHDFRQQFLTDAEINQDFQLTSFVTLIAEELRESGVIEDFTSCHYRSRGIRTDGYWFDDEGILSLFIADFEFRTSLSSLTRTDVDTAFKRLQGFLEASLTGRLHNELDFTTPEYDIARQIWDRRSSIRRVEFYLLSERVLSDRIQSLDDLIISGIPVTRQIWDITRLYRQQNSRGHKEILEIDFPESFGRSLSCLPAHLGSDLYKSYLVVIPGKILADLYEKYGARLLERNVRSFLQARAKVNRGIRSTILNEPQMFFAYNNGLTATAEHVKTRITDNGLVIDSIQDLQIVNGGQTTASLFHTRRLDKADLSKVFVQMKLTVIDDEKNEEIVPRISEYANTQNKVNAADFFSNHPFHVRMEEFSRRLWAPARQGSQRETKWFYERARGQFADAQSKLSASQK